jgi:hypothetical protein
MKERKYAVVEDETDWSPRMRRGENGAFPN